MDVMWCSQKTEIQSWDLLACECLTVMEKASAGQLR